MYEILHIIGIVLAVLAGVALIASVAIFFGCKIPMILKDKQGNLEQKQIEEIRQKSSQAALQRTKVNVFEELEKKAKVKRPGTESLNVGTTTTPLGPEGETELLPDAPVYTGDFVIEQSVVYVGSDEVI